MAKGIRKNKKPVKKRVASIQSIEGQLRRACKVTQLEGVVDEVDRWRKDKRYQRILQIAVVILGEQGLLDEVFKSLKTK